MCESWDCLECSQDCACKNCELTATFNGELLCDSCGNKSDPIEFDIFSK